MTSNGTGSDIVSFVVALTAFSLPSSGCSRCRTLSIYIFKCDFCEENLVLPCVLLRPQTVAGITTEAMLSLLSISVNIIRKRVADVDQGLRAFPQSYSWYCRLNLWDGTTHYKRRLLQPPVLPKICHLCGFYHRPPCDSSYDSTGFP